MKPLVWPVMPYGCEARTLKLYIEEEKHIQAFENKCVRKLLRIPWTKLMTTEQVYKMAGTESELLSRIKSRKLRYFVHIMRLPHDNIEGSVITGLIEGTRNRGRPRTCWIDNSVDVAWTDQSGLRIARDSGRWSAPNHPRSQPSQSDDGDVTWHDMTLARWRHTFREFTKVSIPVGLVRVNAVNAECVCTVLRFKSRVDL